MPGSPPLLAASGYWRGGRARAVSHDGLCYKPTVGSRRDAGSEPGRRSRPAVRCRAVLLAIGLVASAWAAAGVPASRAAAAPPATEFDALSVSPANSSDVLLGTERGIFRTTDGGRSWEPAGLPHQAITSLVRDGKTIFAGGKTLFASSTDGGATWRTLHPQGLPTEDISALATDPGHPTTLYVVLGSGGLYRSKGTTGSFELVSREVGPAIRSIATTRKEILAGDIASGVYRSRTGTTWRQTAGGSVMALAVNRHDPRQVLLASLGISRSRDGGLRWSVVLRSHSVFGAVAWAPNDPSLAYAVDDSGSFWRSTDGGATWRRVTGPSRRVVPRTP